MSTNSCCTPPAHNEHHHGKKFDWILWISFIGILIGYVGHLLHILPNDMSFHHYSSSVFMLMNEMWVGIAVGIVFVGILTKVPREFIIAILGRPNTLSGILRATLAGLLLDMCSHGILLVGMKFYKRGISLGQTMAFLIASPWNSL
ncbi:MAG: permease, partial [Bdellovibrionota bacterium]